MPAQRFFAALLLALSLSPAVQAAAPVVWEIQSPAAMTFDEVGRLQDTVLRQWQQVQAAYRPVDRNAIQPLLTQAGQILQGAVQGNEARRLIAVVVGDEDFHCLDSRCNAVSDDPVNLKGTPVAPGTSDGSTGLCRRVLCPYHALY